jgi:putative heme-binding domain-containing protein
VSGIARALILFAAGLPVAFAQSGSGRDLFEAHCAGCHGLDARGGDRAPDILARVQRMADQAVSNVIERGVPTAGMPAFGQRLDTEQRRRIVAYLRELQGSGAGANPEGDARRGEALFFGKAGCGGCHAMRGRGKFFGPDLTSYGASHGPVEIRTAILDPNRNYDPRRGVVTVRTRSGKTVRGLIRNEDNFSLQMQSADGVFHLFDKVDVAQIRREEHSLMPVDYGQRLDASEMSNLVRFLSRIDNEKQ